MVHMPYTLLCCLAIIIIEPYAVNRITRSSAARLLLAFPMLAGILQIGVSLWNINLII